jgi:GR25 family glycosyltransferase involved in LPS biosynthesis
MFQTFYDKVIVLSQPERIDRRKQFMRNADAIELEFEFYDSVKKDTPRDSFNWSHYQILMHCAEAEYDRVLILEDDCAFESVHWFEKIHIELIKQNWAWMYYGCNARPYPDHRTPGFCSTHLRTISSAYTTHAIGYTHSLITAILSYYRPNTAEMYDAFLDRLILPSIPAHVSIPFLCVQKPAFSDLWNRNVDYSDTFKASEEYLRNICSDT